MRRGQNSQSQPPNIAFPFGEADASLAHQSRDNRQAFSPLFERYWEQVYRYCYYRLGDWADAEDAAGQVFLNALTNISHFHAGSRDDAFRCRLFTIARNQTANTRRWNFRHRTESLDPAMSSTGGYFSPEDAAIRAEAHQELHALLVHLKPDQRNLIQLRLSGLTDQEIARIVGRSHVAVRKAQSRALAELRTQMIATSDLEHSDVAFR